MSAASRLAEWTSSRITVLLLLTISTARIALGGPAEMAGGMSSAGVSDETRAVSARLRSDGPDVFNVETSPYGARCDGINDDSVAINSALGAASKINDAIVYFPGSATPCMVARPLNVPGHVTLFAYPGTATLQVMAASTASPQLLSISNVSNILVYGLTLDGNLSASPAHNNLNAVYNASDVVFDHVTLQNSRGIGIVFSTNIIHSGIRDSVVNNVGNYWKTTGDNADQQQGVAFCCGATLTTSASQAGISAVLNFESVNAVSVGNLVFGTDVPLGTYVTRVGSLDVTMSTRSKKAIPGGTNIFFAKNIGNFVKNSVFVNTGLDAMSLADQRCATVSGNRCERVGGRGENGGACVYASGDYGLVVTDNIAEGSYGNGIDVIRQAFGLIQNNTVIRTASRGISVDTSVDLVIKGNHVLDSQEYTTNNGKGGINLSGTLDNISILGNESRDDQPRKTQPYGIAITRGSAATNLFLASDNLLAGNSQGEVLDEGHSGFVQRQILLPPIDCRQYPLLQGETPR